jgi:hypothetical protein
MKKFRSSGHPRSGKIALFVVLGALGVACSVSGLLFESSILSGQPIPENPPIGSSGVFTPSHPSVSLAVRHFFGLRPEPVQPIAYDHKAHIEKAQMECLDCHIAATAGPRATIPGVTSCMSCHNTIATDKPAIQQVAAYFNKGEDIPWQRVYGWNDEAHVRFNHAPHLAASVQCAKCHGDVGGMAVAKRIVDHSMGFCITCHKERKASLDCVTCHF